MADPERLRRALAAIDAANAGDPNQIRARGALRPKELAHAELASEWVRELCPAPSEALLLAARAHHVRRWQIPRDTYPEGTVGYHAWRRALQALHAAEVGRILGDVGCEPALVARVQDLVRKRGLGRDAEVQVLEDALCLVFLETQLAELAAGRTPDALVEILRRTLRKMSPAAIARAQALPLEPGQRALLARAAAAP